MQHIWFMSVCVRRDQKEDDSMDVFGKIGDTIVNVGKDVSSKAKE